MKQISRTLLLLLNLFFVTTLVVQPIWAQSTDEEGYSDYCHVNPLMQGYFGSVALKAEDLGEILSGLAKLSLEGLSEGKRLMLPLGAHGNHWAGVYLRLLNGQLQAFYFDSLGRSYSHDEATALCRLLEEQSGLPVVFYSNPWRYQIDCYNCGPWVVEFFRYADRLLIEGVVPEQLFNRLDTILKNLDIRAARREQARFLSSGEDARSTAVSAAPSNIKHANSVDDDHAAASNSSSATKGDTDSEEAKLVSMDPNAAAVVPMHSSM